MNKKTMLQLLLPVFVLSISILAYSLHTKASQLPVNGSAGTVDDPLVTKSYVDEQIKKLMIDPKFNQTTPNIGGSSNTDIIVLKLEQGQTLYGGAGAEFVVRTGKAKVYTTDQNGIADLTLGKDLLNGEIIQLNHLLLFPRDGRGIQPDPNDKAEIYVIIKGNHLLIDKDGNVVNTK